MFQVGDTVKINDPKWERVENPNQGRSADEFVHELEGRWVVAEYRDGRYYAPQRADVRRLTGCTTTFGPLSYVAGDAYSYKRRADALRRAREVYGL